MRFEKKWGKLFLKNLTTKIRPAGRHLQQDTAGDSMCTKAVPFKYAGYAAWGTFHGTRTMNFS